MQDYSLHAFFHSKRIYLFSFQIYMNFLNFLNGRNVTNFEYFFVTRFQKILNEFSFFIIIGIIVV